MADIKTRDVVKGTIKTIDKAAIASECMKAAYAKTKDKAERGFYSDENSTTEYATDRASGAAERVTKEGIHQFDTQGRKAVKETRANIGTAKEKLTDFKQKRAVKAAETGRPNLGMSALPRIMLPQVILPRERSNRHHRRQSGQSRPLPLV